MVVHRAGAEGSVFGWCIKLTIWPLTSSPASNRSVPPPFSPESVFTNGAMHANDPHMGGAFLFFSEMLNWTMGEVIFHFEMIIAGILK